ncbi:hypothetical protein GPECTOR_64g109 [Gonium pectorale]|uniref:Uncharacterized protein n=1 Tax=Gonium pectorale TaxID=33097 RepID=A0A150G504_GONPE|nr:hypothetical protein GPECTOR_64g109 [Gonium pectorale]|eukprot:KXZ44615.1 hypothetical protein GPECTOR_64g109 [Gonium pectorale]
MSGVLQAGAFFGHTGLVCLAMGLMSGAAAFGAATLFSRWLGGPASPGGQRGSPEPLEPEPETGPGPGPAHPSSGGVLVIRTRGAARPVVDV